MMYPIFVIVFVTLVNTEWVEITQRNHRQPDNNNHNTIKYTTNTNSDNNSELNKVNLESGTRETLFKSKKQSEIRSDLKRPVKGNRIYIKHDDDADRLTLSYPRDYFLKDDVELNKNSDISRSNNVEKNNLKSHTEGQKIEANKKEDKVFITQKSSNKQDRESLENINDTEVRKNNFKKSQGQENIHDIEQNTNHKTTDANHNAVKSTTERIRVITSKKGNRIYFLYNNNRPSLVKNKIVSAKNYSDIKVQTQNATEINQLEEKHKVIKNSTEKNTSHKSVENQHQEQRTQSFNSNNHRSTSTTQIIDKIKPYKKNKEEQDNTKDKITDTINKIESKPTASETEVTTTNKNDHKINTNTRNYFTTEAVKVLTSKKGNKIYFIFKDIDEPTLENYENITEVTSPSTAIDKSLELETLDKSSKKLLQSNTKQSYETVTDDTTKNTKENEMNVIEKIDNTSISNAKNKETSNLNLPEKVTPEIENNTSKNKWIKGHVYRVPNLAHVSKINKNDPELLNITHINHDKENRKEDTNKDGNSEDNIFIKEHPTAIVDKTKLENYDELPIRRKVDVISDGENTPEFVTIQDQDFEERFEEIYIVDGEDEISELLEEEMKRTENQNFRLDPDEKSYIDSVKSDYPTSEEKDESEINHKRNPIENIIKFMKVVADNIAKNTHTSYESKIRYLKELKESIMRSIEERIDAAWPDDVPRSRREARGHHIEFPSSESALMSISFLTFAVYLIKLVLYVIQAYKNKATTFPAVVAISRAAELANKLVNNN